jgi:hypothetical protein
MHRFNWGDNPPTFVGTPAPRSGPADPLDYRLTWGKFKGSTLRELTVKWDARHYLKYMLTRDLDEYDASYIQRALDATPEVDPTYAEARAYEMKFGMWKGETLGNILDGHKRGAKYLRWLVDTTKCSPQLLEAINMLLQA